MPAEPSKGGTVECKQCYRAAGQQARVQIEVHFVIGTWIIRYILDNGHPSEMQVVLKGSREGYR